MIQKKTILFPPQIYANSIKTALYRPMQNAKYFYTKVVLSNLRPYRKNIIFIVFKIEYIRHIFSYMGIPCHVLFYSIRHLINAFRAPKLYFTCLINGCKGVKKSPFLSAGVYRSLM